MKTILRRHGDVLIKTKQGFKISDDLEFKPVKILYSGQNHDHYFSKGKVIESTQDSKRVIRVIEDAELSHGRGSSTEHKTRPLPIGDYWIEIQSEMDHLKNIKREVID